MKKLLALILAAALALSLVACGGGSGAGDTNTSSTGSGDTTSADTPSGGNDTSSNQTEYTSLQLNETVTTTDGNFEATLTSIDFVGTSDEIGDYTVEVLDSDKVLLRCCFSLNFIGKESLNTSFILPMKVSYGDGYIFKERRTYIQDGDTLNRIIHVDSKGTTNSKFMNFEPLASDTYLGYTYLEVPKEVETNSDEKLSILISIGDGFNYLYNIR